jgi:uncharacterized protein YutE (UPF0331/DUF86 family)
MTVRPGVVLARLAHLAHVLAQLERLRSMSQVERLRDPLHELAAERAMHVAAEAIFDIGHHVLAGRSRPVPSTYRDIVPALVAEGILETSLGNRLSGMAGLRNILVHDYVDIDPARVWEAVDEHLEDLENVLKALSSLPELAHRR